MNWRVFTIAVASVVLFANMIFADFVVLDRTSLALVGVIAVLALWPTLKSAKIPYAFDIKRKDPPKKVNKHK